METITSPNLPFEMSVDGNDGSGKTTISESLVEKLSSDGLIACTFAPFRRANVHLGEDIYGLWHDDSTVRSALTVLKDAIKSCRDEAKDLKADVVIYDRHWMSVMTELIGDIHHYRHNTPEVNAANQRLLHEHGIDLVPAAYLRTDKETSLKRSQNDHDQPWMEGQTFDDYHTKFELIANSHVKHLLGIYRSDDDVSIDALVRNINWDLNVRR